MHIHILNGKGLCSVYHRSSVQWAVVNRGSHGLPQIRRMKKKMYFSGRKLKVLALQVHGKSAAVTFQAIEALGIVCH